MFQKNKTQETTENGSIEGCLIVVLQVDGCLGRLGVSRLLRHFCGFIGPAPPASWCSALYSLFTDLTTLYNFFTLGVLFVSPGLSLSDRCTVGFPIMAMIHAIFRQTYLLVRRERFGNLLKSYCDLDAGAVLKARWSNLVLIVVMVTPMAAWCLGPVVMFLTEGGPRRFSVPAWLPTDMADSDAAFFTTALLQVLGATFTLTKNFAFDDLFLGMGLAQLDRFKLLGSRFAGLFAVHRIAEDGTLSFWDYDERRVTPEEAAELLKERLHVWITRHQQCINLRNTLHIELATRQMKELQDLYSPTFLILFTIQTIQLCFSAFVVVAAPLTRIQLVFCAFYVIGNILELFFTCRMGDLLSDQSGDMTGGVIDGGCVAAASSSPRLSSTLLITLIRAEKHQPMSAIRVFPLNTDTFRAVTPQCYPQ
ncbi:hypothetical protein AAG570_001505 [Ranatra chinensis]|uniref:Odorant receptor n=1 Tax=Ranatra chinensis TaxID=642074 RepID=A0ABD0YKS6_9HEMI